MPYERLAGLLDTADSPRIATLPDGSIDRYCTVFDSSGDPMESRESFGSEILGDRSSLEIQVDSIEPGGQAVNAAEQLHALGGRPTCYGHLDAPLFDSLPFETVSMGEPSFVDVYTFTDRDVMFVDNSAVTEWELATLRRASDLSTVFGGDAVCCHNWVSVPGLAAAFHELADEALPRVPFVFDPGDIVGAEDDEIERLLDALATLQETVDVIYTGNREEIRTTATPLANSSKTDLDRLDAIRSATGIRAVVMHGRDEAALATRDGRERVSNYTVDDPERHTGSGDRFTAGLCHGLACGWDWDVALACGNACAVYHVETGRTGDAEDIVRFVSGRPSP